MKRIISISICMVFLLSASTILLAPQSEMTFEQFIEKVEGKIEHRNEKLKEHFSEGKYELMPGQFKFKAKLVTHEGEVVSGEDSENYWRKIDGELGGTDLIIEDSDLKFMKLELSLEPEEPGYEDQFNYVAVEVTEFSFRVGERTYRGLIDPTYRHRVRCTWH